MNTQLLLIDPQNDFHDQENAALGVPGALEDARRVATLIEKYTQAIDAIHVTLDTHQLLDVAHPLMWVDRRGRHPAPFTLISYDQVDSGVWRAADPAFQSRLQQYVLRLEHDGRNPLCIWPPHCLVGSWGHGVVEPVWQALCGWESARLRRVDYLTKGQNPWTEHYSAVRAEVPDAADPGTRLNTQLITTLEQADLVLVAGQALSHCVAGTVRDIADHFAGESIRKLVLIEDASSPVPGYEKQAADFIAGMKARGMQTIKASEVRL